ncbi:MAG: glycosyltransferase family 1 protein, partial [Cyanobacteriota bacterium]
MSVPRLSPVRFLVPGTTGKFRCGGLLVEMQTAGLVASLRPT